MARKLHEKGKPQKNNGIKTIVRREYEAKQAALKPVVKPLTELEKLIASRQPTIDKAKKFKCFRPGIGMSLDNDPVTDDVTKVVFLGILDQYAATPDFKDSRKPSAIDRATKAYIAANPQQFNYVVDTDEEEAPIRAAATKAAWNGVKWVEEAVKWATGGMKSTKPKSAPKAASAVKKVLVNAA